MATTRLAPRGLLALCASAIALLAGCGDGKGASQGAAAPLAVTTVEVAPKTLPLVIETVGRSEGSKEVEVRARVSGILEKQNYSEGTQVKAGQLLFRIEASPYEIALAHARAALAEEQARNVQARRNADRLTGLAKANAVSRRIADDALSTVESSDAALLAAQANVREAELNLSYTKVVAPISGITGRALHSEGSLLNASTESSLLTTLTQADPMWVRFALSENEYATLRTVESSKPDSLSLALLDKNGSPRAAQGKLNFSGSTIDQALGTVQLRAEFPNPELAMLPGEYLRVRLSGGAREAMTVPQKAVLQSAQGRFVWVVNGEGKAQQRKVTTGTWIGTDWEISDGLQPGDVVIVDNLLKLKADQPVARRSAAATPPQQAEADRAAPAQTPANARQSG
jgi:membrane fusion protein (multidrug efflux system)